MVKKSSNSIKVIIIATAVIFACAGLIFARQWFLPLQGYLTSMAWVEVDATLLSASIDSQTVTDNQTRRVSINYAANVSYQYSFGAETYTAHRVSWSKVYDTGYWYHKAQNLQSKFARGEPIKVFLDPDSPQNVVIYRDVNWSRWWIFLFVSVVFWALAIGFIYFYRKKM